MLVIILAGANLATLLLMWAVCMSTYIDPVQHPRISQAGLLFPIFLCINLAFILVWLLVSKRWLLLPLLGLASCWSYIRDYCPLNLNHDHTGNSVLVLSYNVASLVATPSETSDGYKAVDYIAASGADIICLQECPGGGTVFNSLKHKMDSLGYHMKHDMSMCIISRWPFVGDVVYRTGGAYGNGSLAWSVCMEGDTILVINNHLQSNGISNEEKNVYAGAIDSYDKDKMKTSGKLLFSRLTQAASKRAVQTDSVCRVIGRHSGQRIIAAGDLNDTPISYTYQSISRHLSCAYRESGNGLGFSFTGKGFPVRIDHIFVSNHWQIGSTYVDSSIRASDHLPILTRLYPTE